MLIISGPHHSMLPPGNQGTAYKTNLVPKSGLLYFKPYIDLHKPSCLWTTALRIAVSNWIHLSLSVSSTQFKRYDSFHPDFDNWQLRLGTLERRIFCMYSSYSLLIWGSYLFICLFLYQSSSPHSCEREKVASPFTEGTRTSFLYKEKKTFWGERRQAKYSGI